MRVLSASDVRAVFTIERAVESQRAAFTRLGEGVALVPPRLLVPGVAESVAFCYAARLGKDAPAVSKFGSVNPGNVTRGVGAVNAVVTVLDPETGIPVALMDGTSVTELRTAAATALAARTLAAGAMRILLVGAGVQAAAHLEAIAFTHPGASMGLWGRRQEAVAELAARSRIRLGREISIAEDLAVAVGRSDLVVLCTTASTPVLRTDWVRSDATVISIGSFAPDRSEVSPSLLARASAVVVDQRSSALTDAGPVVDAVRDGLITPEGLIELSEVLLGAVPVLPAEGAPVFYNSVGLGVQDAAAAEVIVAEAARAGVGQVVSLG